MWILEEEFSLGCPLFMYEDTTPTIMSNGMMLIGSKLKALTSLINHSQHSSMFGHPFLFDWQW